MTTDELNAIVQAVMLEMEKAGVDFDFKAETPQADDLVYVMRGTADNYQGITVKWQNLLDIIVQKATEARDDAISAKDIALQALEDIRGIGINISLMKSSVETTKSQVETMKGEVSTMKASVETSEANVTQMKSEVSEMKSSVEGTKTEVEGLKSDVTALKAQTQTIVDNAKEDVTGLLDTKVDYSDSLTYEEIMATNPVPDLTNKVASASALKELATLDLLWENANPSTVFGPQTINLDLSDYKMVCVTFKIYQNTELYIDSFSFIDGKKYDASIPNNDFRHRTYTVNNNNIVFDNAEYAQAFQGSFTIYNVSMIPTHIYGIK